MEQFTIWVPEIDDDGIRDVLNEIRTRDPEGKAIARVVRRTFDQLYDGQRTGRYKVDQLYKTEKTHFGTLLEINLQKEFRFPDGEILDFKIADREVDCKYSHSGQWMLPIESFEQIVLVVQADDVRSVWSMGVVRVTESNRRSSENRDRKTGLNAEGRRSIAWIFQDAPFQPNALLRLAPSDVAEIMDSGKSGQGRVNELFRRAVGRRITRNIVATVAQQDDFMKRVRNNGGARGVLRPEGYLILSGDYLIQREIARSLHLPEPMPGEFVSVRVVPAEAGNGVEIEGSWWRRANENENVDSPAPTIRAR